MRKMILLLLAFILIAILVQVIYTTYYLRKGSLLSQTVYSQTYEAGDKIKPVFKVLVTGDSIAAGVGSSSFETSVTGRIANYLSENHHVILKNGAYSGAKMADLLNRPVSAEKQDLIVLIVSSNNLFRFTDLSEFKKATKEVLSRYSILTNKLIIVGPGRVFDAPALPWLLRQVYKIQAPKYAAIIGDEAKRYPNIIYINPINPPKSLPEYGHTLADDNFHPNDEGHRFWFDMIKTGL